MRQNPFFENFKNELPKYAQNFVVTDGANESFIFEDGKSSNLNTSSNKFFMIPSKNDLCDSLNLSVSAGILIYEAVRKNNKLDKNIFLYLD